MSGKAPAEMRKRSALPIAPSHGLARVPPTLTADNLGNGPAVDETEDRVGLWTPYVGFNFASLQVHPDPGTDPQTQGFEAQSCPLSLSTPRACPFGGACHICPARAQTKLAINKPGDEFEQEANWVAEQVMRMPDDALRKSPDAVVRRKCGSCDDDQEPFHRKVARPSEFGFQPSDVPPIIHEVLRSPGQPLDPATRAFMEPRFGYDFSQVRMHTDAQGAQSARAVNALAYTVGREIVFAAGQYALNTFTGRQLLAHELAHTIQQGVSKPLGPLQLCRLGDPLEQQASAVASDARSDGISRLGNGAMIERLPASGPDAATASADAVAADDGVTAREARQSLVRRIGEERLRRLLAGGLDERGEAEAERAASQITSGQQAPLVARMTGFPSLQRVGPAVVVAAALAAVAACAFGFYFYALDHYGHKSDKWLHCYTSCKIATYCGSGSVTLLIGAGKEVLDYLCDQLGGPCGAEWDDFFADLEGIACAYQFWRRCTTCCDQARPS